MIDLLLNAALVLTLLVALAAALVVLAFAPPYRRRVRAPRRSASPRLSRSGLVRAPAARRRRAA